MQTVQNKLVTIEARKRLSESLIWHWQRQFFTSQGMSAWSQGTVPHHISSSPFLAEAYAKVVLGFLRDRMAGKTVSGIDQPVYILELGSGSARLAFRFLSRLRQLMNGARLSHVRPIYIMSDFTPETIASWRKHPWLRPFVDEGMLDFACLDIEHEQSLRLEISGQTITGASLAHPLVVFANYVFDSLPQDAFTIRQGGLREMLVSLSSTQEETDLDDAGLLMRVAPEYASQPAASNYYAQDEWNILLEQYRSRLPDVAFTFPVAALRCLAWLERLSGGRMLMLAGDCGYHSDMALAAGKGNPEFSRHGSVSMLVDFQLLGAYVELRGGEAWHPDRPQQQMNISALLLGAGAHIMSETKLAYEEMTGKFSPEDFTRLKEGVERLHDGFTLDELLAFLRLSRWDHLRFCTALPMFKAGMPGYDDAQREQIAVAVARTWENYFPIGEERDLAFDMGTLLLQMGRHREALAMLAHSARLYEMQPGTAFNTALCHYRLGEMDAALAHADQALALDPSLDYARLLRTTIIEQRSAGCRAQNLN